MTQSVTAQPADTDALAAWTTNVFNDTSELYRAAGMTGLQAPSVVGKLVMKANAETYGSTPFNSKGYFFTSPGSFWTAAAPGIPVESTTLPRVVLNSNSGAEQLIGSFPILYCPNSYVGPITIKGISGSLFIGAAGVIGASASNEFTRYDIQLSKISATGTETVLYTVTAQSGINLQVNNGSYVGTFYTFSFQSLNSGAGYVIGATERLCITIKVYGISSNSNDTAVSLNADGGLTATPTNTADKNHSWLALAL